MPPRIAVIGSGVAGLVCAYELKKVGFNVTVFEKEGYVGGRMSTLRKDGLLFDRGANFYLVGYPTIKSYVDELDLSDQWQELQSGLHVLWRNGSFHNLSLDTVRDALRFKGISLWSRIRLLIFMLRARITCAHLNFYDLSSIPDHLLARDAYDMAASRTTRETADFITDPFTRTMQFHSSKEISAGAALALLFLMAKGDGSFNPTCMKGGMSALSEGLAKNLDVRLNQPVDTIEGSGKRISVTSKGKKLLFDGVVINAPASAALKMIQHPTSFQKEVLAGTRYATTINVSLKIPIGSLSEVKCCYVPFHESRIISEFTNESSKGIKTKTHTIVNIGLHEETAKEIINRSDKQIFSTVIREFTRLCPGIKATPHALHRWTCAMPVFSGPHIKRVKRFLAQGQGENNIYFAADWLNSPWTEGSARCGKRVAQQIRQQFME